MTKSYDIELIKELIGKGYDLELLSYELEIPVEELNYYKQQLEATSSESRIPYYKLEEIRKKYYELYKGVEAKKVDNKKTANKKDTKLSQEEIAFINSVITAVEGQIEKTKSTSITSRQKAAIEILDQTSKIKEYELTLEQAEKLCQLMEYINWANLGKKGNAINNVKKSLETRLAQAVKKKADETNDIEQLEQLAKKITTKMQSRNQIGVAPIANEIKNKIEKLKMKSSIDRIRTAISPSIISIAESLANGTFDIQQANKAIDEEASKKVTDGVKTKFSLSQEQQRKQIILQIENQIMENASKCLLVNPDTTILQLQQLGVDEADAMRVVAKNLIERKEYQQAKRICEQFSRLKDTEQYAQIYSRTLRNEIRNAELGDMVLKGINMRGTLQEEKKYWEKIEEGLKRGNIKLTSILLGKSQDDSRSITLADIWSDEIER